MVQPAGENARKLEALISAELKTSIESANKSADSDEKSANRMSGLNKRQKEILTIMENGEEYTTQAIAGAIGYYIVEFEQNEKDRAEYGPRLLTNWAKKLSIKGLDRTVLNLCRIIDVNCC